MGRIVLNHYPAAKLPEDLRGEIPEAAIVRVTVEEQSRAMSREQLVALTRSLHANPRGTTIDEAVGRVRALRDEWDD